MTSTTFADRVMRDFRVREARATGYFDKSMSASAGAPSPLLLESKALGHPDFENLDIGEMRKAPMVAVFLDLRRFTARTFWDDPMMTASLAHAVLGGFVEVVQEFGGYPLGLRGDGLFAGFSPGDEQLTAAAALMGCAQALHLVRTEVNPRLQEEGIAPVYARAGVDYGDIVFARTGVGAYSEVNPVGFAANFASKCEKHASAWGIVAGEGLRQLLPANHLFTPHEDSPQQYSRDYLRRNYAFYDFNWESFIEDLPGMAAQIGGRPISSISNTGGQPR